jgi:hypothetical protein
VEQAKSTPAWRLTNQELIVVIIKMHDHLTKCVSPSLIAYPGSSASEPSFCGFVVGLFAHNINDGLTDQLFVEIKSICEDSYLIDKL